MNTNYEGINNSGANSWR